MVSINNITKEFDGEVLFSNVTFNINSKDRIGLAGKNGAGKTTLLRLINGDISMDRGQVIIPDDMQIGYLPQEKEIESNRNILEEVLQVYSFLEQLRKRNEEIIMMLDSQNHDYQSKAFQDLLEEQNRNEEQIRLAEPEKLRGKAERILIGLGFERTDFIRPVSEFSYGWQMRVEIAKLLLVNPFLLLLDEPTNHLDIESIQWLEDYLINYNGAVVVVSHDRTLLDSLTNRTIEINNGRIYDYKVPYSEFIQLRENRLMHQKAAFNNQQKEIKEIERFIERFRYKSTKARQVQSRVKHLEKINRVEVDDVNESAIRFTFPSAPHSGKITVSGKSISKNYGKKKVLEKLDFQILRGEKIAFVGRNGEGKSTLAKIIANKISYSGELLQGHNVITAYFSQDQWEMLDPDLSVFETLDNIAVGDVRKRLKTILGAFLFQGDDVDKKVKVLSGGEKSRLALAKLLLTPSNLLLLDEPTNHLDILSKDILKNALLQYNGTLIIVSHDRDFLQGLTERLYEFKDQKIKEYRGDIFTYLEKRKISHLKELERNNELKNKQSDTSSENKLNWEKRKEIEKQIRKLDSAIMKMEGLIEEKESEINKLDTKLSEPDKYVEQIQSGELYKLHDQVTSGLNSAYIQWENLEREKENLFAKLKLIKS